MNLKRQAAAHRASGLALLGGGNRHADGAAVDDVARHLS